MHYLLLHCGTQNIFHTAEDEALNNISCHDLTGGLAPACQLHIQCLPTYREKILLLKSANYAFIFSHHKMEDIVYKPADYAFNACRCKVEDLFHMKTDMQLLLLWSGRPLPHENRYAALAVMEWKTSST